MKSDAMKVAFVVLVSFFAIVMVSKTSAAIEPCDAGTRCDCNYPECRADSTGSSQPCISFHHTGCTVWTPGSPNGFDIPDHDCDDYRKYVPGCDEYEEAQQERSGAAEAEAADCNGKLSKCQEDKKKFKDQRDRASRDATASHNEYVECSDDLQQSESNLTQCTTERASDLRRSVTERQNAVIDVLGACIEDINRVKAKTDLACKNLSALIASGMAGGEKISSELLSQLKGIKNSVCPVVTYKIPQGAIKKLTPIPAINVPKATTTPKKK